MAEMKQMKTLTINDTTYEVVDETARSSANTINTTLTQHATNTNNPHGVTAAQVGADASGSAAQALIDAKAYTDSEIEDIQIGGRNLFLNTGKEISNNEHNIATYVPADEPLVDGETYTISICVTPATGVSYLGVMFSGGYKRVERLHSSGNSKQILTSTFIMSYADGRTPEDRTANANCIIRREPDDGTVTENTTIHWIKIEKGNKATDWTPAPEDILAEANEYTDAAIKDIQIGGRNLLKNSGSGIALINSDSSYKDVSLREAGKITTLLEMRGNGYIVATSYLVKTPAEITEKIGAEYSFSVDVKVTGSFTDLKATYSCRDGDWGVLYNCSAYHDGETYDQWIRLKGTSKIEKTGGKLALILIEWSGSTVGSTIEYRNFKLEAGNKATDWTPAPEDILADANEYTDAAIEDIQIGGRNLLLNTTEAREVTAPSTGDASINSRYTTYNMVLSPSIDEIYTISADVKVLAGDVSKISVAFYDEGFTTGFETRADIVDGRIKKVVIIARSNMKKLLLYAGVSGSTAGNSVTFSKVKFEKGNKATDWTPAPEDVDDAVNTAQTTADIAKANAATAQTKANEAATAAANAQATADTAKANAEAAQNTADTHAKNKENPHAVTAEQVGADVKGAAAQALTDAKTYTDDKIEDIQIGGRNLLRYTKDLPIGANKIWSWGGDTPPLTDTEEGLKLTITKYYSSLQVPLVYDGAVENGETVTLSFDYRGNLPDLGIIYFIQRTSPNVSLKPSCELTVSETEWQHCEVTFSSETANIRTCYSMLMFYGLDAYTGRWVEIKDKSLKLEKGNKATDWSEASEDILAEAKAYTDTEKAKYLPLKGGTLSGALTVNNKITQGSPSSDSTISEMNRFKNDLFVEGSGAAPTIPKVAGFYLGKSTTDENRHMDIVSGSTYSYIDFNKAGSNEDYDVRLLVNVENGDTVFRWGFGEHLTEKNFNVLGTIRQNGSRVALKSDIPDLSGYLPLSGGTMTGAIYSTTDMQLRPQTGVIRFGDSLTTGSLAVLAGAYDAWYLRPGSDNVFDLGTIWERWKNLYLSGVLSDGTNSIAVANIANKNNYLPLTGGTLTGSLVAPVYKSDNSAAAIKLSSDNEVSFGSSTNRLYIGYQNRVGSSGSVDTYIFGTHSGVNGEKNGTIICGTINAKSGIFSGTLSDGTNSIAVANIANKNDIATTKYASTSTSAQSIFKISEFGNWGSGAWYQKGFSMLITSRAGETVWLTLSANDSNTIARAIRLMNTYSKIFKIHYSVSESAIYVTANAWCNSVSAHIISNLYGDYVPTVATASALASDAVEISITEMGPSGSSTSFTTKLGNTSAPIDLLGSADRPKYNSADLALYSDIPAIPDIPDVSGYLPLSGGTMTGSITIPPENYFNIVSGAGIRGNATGDLFLNAKNGSIYLRPEASNSGISGIKVGDNMLGPEDSMAMDLGSSYRLFKDVHLSGGLTDGSNYISVANIANKNDYLPITGGTMKGELVVDGGTSGGASKIVLATGKGHITDSSTRSLFGSTKDGAALTVGHSNYYLLLRGRADRPSYNNSYIALESDISNYLPLSGGTMRGELIVNGKNAIGGSKIVLESGNGQITNSGKQTLFGFLDSSQLVVGHSNYSLAIRGSATRPAYNGKDLALYGDLSTYLPLSGGTMTGLLNINMNSNTVTIGSQNNGFCHIYNSADIPFIFNKTVATTSGDLGVSNYPWKNLYLSGVLSDGTSSISVANIANKNNYLSLSGGTLSGTLNFSDSNSWVTPYLLAFKNADPNSSPAYPYTGFYQWNNEWQVNARDANNVWQKNIFSINLDTSVAAFLARPTVNGAEVALRSDIPDVSSYLPLTGGTLTGSLVAPVYKSDNTESAIKLSDGNEVNFGSNSNLLYIGYENRVGSSGKIDTYKFGTHSGTDGATSGTIECGTIKAKSGIFSGALKVNDGGGYIAGRVYGSGDDEGLIIGRAANGYAGLILGTHDSTRSVFYLRSDNVASWRYVNATTAELLHPGKSGTIATTADLPSSETWTFTLEDGSTVTKAVCIG